MSFLTKDSVDLTKPLQIVYKAFIIDKIDGFRVLAFNVAYVANDRIVRTHGCN